MRDGHEQSVCLAVRFPKAIGLIIRSSPLLLCSKTTLHVLHGLLGIIQASSGARLTPIVGFVQEIRPTVLVIDDDPDFGELISVIIEDAGCRPIVALDGKFGLDLAAEISPALILCDNSMPGLSGEDVLRLLQDDPALADVPRVMMSGFGCPDLRTVPADAFIAKPINTQSLRRLVRAFTRPPAAGGPEQKKRRPRLAEEP